MADPSLRAQLQRLWQSDDPIRALKGLELLAASGDRALLRALREGSSVDAYGDITRRFRD